MIHPYGQVIDLISRPYRTMMRYSLDLPPMEVCWYPAPPGAKVIEVPTVFHSRDWDDPHWNPDDVGEVWPYDDEGCKHRRPYAPNCVCVHYTGQFRVGSDEVWENGGVLGRDPVYVTEPDGSLPEFGPVVSLCWTGGGDVDGGTGEFSWTDLACEEVPWGCLVLGEGGDVDGGVGEFSSGSTAVFLDCCPEGVGILLPGTLTATFSGVGTLNGATVAFVHGPPPDNPGGPPQWYWDGRGSVEFSGVLMISASCLFIGGVRWILRSVNGMGVLCGMAGSGTEDVPCEDVFPVDFVIPSSTFTSCAGSGGAQTVSAHVVG